MRILLLSLLLSIPAFCQSTGCTQDAAISISASGASKIISAIPPSKIRICTISLSASAQTDITLSSGTGTACATSNIAKSGAYKNVLSLALGFGQDTGPIIGSGRDFCITSSAVVTIGGMITYSVY